MPWTWRYEKADGAVVSGAGLQEAIFASQGDAESWLGENWRELLDSGVDQVSLFDDSRKQYETFFSLWKDADANLPALQQAHREYADINAGDSRF